MANTDQHGNISLISKSRGIEQIHFAFKAVWSIDTMWRHGFPSSLFRERARRLVGANSLLKPVTTNW